LQPAGKILITDKPYAETKKHIGGLRVMEAADLDEALAWGRRRLSGIGRVWSPNAYFIPIASDRSQQLDAVATNDLLGQG